MNSLLIVIFGLLHVADGIVTYLGLSFAELEEVNPVLNAFSEQLGLGFSITLLKLVCLTVIAFLFYRRRRMKSRWITVSLGSAVTFYSWVISNNVFLVVYS
jgi:hypothetical protein